MLRCEGLTKTFDGVVALNDVSLDFPNDGIISIIGPNGAGKTSLINLLTGFVKPDSGRCFLGTRGDYAPRPAQDRADGCGQDLPGSSANSSSACD